MDHVAFQAISGSPFFKGLAKEALKDLAGVCRRQELKKRDVLFSEGTKGGSLFLLASGCIQLQKTTADGREVVIRTIKKGEVFAEVILFEQDRYPVTAVALIDSVVIAIAKGDILSLLDRPLFRNEFMASLMRKQRYLAERVHYLTSRDVEERFFLFIRQHYGEDKAVKLDLSKKDIAAAIGASPETFSRLIKRLSDSGTLSWEQKTMRIHPGVWAGLS
ncbi:MAG: Crp/Fnr family transcriptional regulator [Kiritimatiellia bacterium]|jgi:CRP/FNR family transcriptional regulator|nr:Crp/Fnr family transcriptional regulator [Kiritimatiellia bacterium]MDP6847168.1 Crp/Fnr family transcriptional regulator [Kiritimatiellia bacterium]